MDASEAGTNFSRGTSSIALMMRRSVTSLGRTWLSTMLRRCRLLSVIALARVTRPDHIQSASRGPDPASLAPVANRRKDRNQAASTPSCHLRTLHDTCTLKASWQSGHAPDCKSVHSGSIPDEASNLFAIRLAEAAVHWRPCREYAHETRRLCGSRKLTAARLAQTPFGGRCAEKRRPQSRKRLRGVDLAIDLL